MFCSHCGKPVGTDARFCSRCGAAQAAAPPSSAGSVPALADRLILIGFLDRGFDFVQRIAGTVMPRLVQLAHLLFTTAVRLAHSLKSRAVRIANRLGPRALGLAQRLVATAIRGAGFLQAWALGSGHRVKALLESFGNRWRSYSRARSEGSAVFCTRCGQRVGAEHRFCSQCGAAQGAPAPSATPQSSLTQLDPAGDAS